MEFIEIRNGLAEENCENNDCEMISFGSNVGKRKHCVPEHQAKEWGGKATWKALMATSYITDTQDDTKINDFVTMSEISELQ